MSVNTMTEKPLSLQKGHVKNRAIDRYQSAVKNAPQFLPKPQPVNHPIFCFSCQQAVVETKNQACPSCVVKIKNSNDSIRVRPSLVVFFMVGVASLVYLFFSWLLPVIEPISGK